jgi:hypothetical protein
MTWNREHAGVAATPDVAIAWSVTAMAEATQRLAAAGDWEQSRVAVAAGVLGLTGRRRHRRREPGSYGPGCRVGHAGSRIGWPG